MRRMAHQALQGAEARLDQLQRQCDKAFTAYKVNPSNDLKKERARRTEIIGTQGRTCCEQPGNSSWCCKCPRLADLLCPVLTRLHTLLLSFYIFAQRFYVAATAGFHLAGDRWTRLQTLLAASLHLTTPAAQSQRHLHCEGATALVTHCTCDASISCKIDNTMLPEGVAGLASPESDPLDTERFASSVRLLQQRQFQTSQSSAADHCEA